jgi:hypothetical protein
VLIGGVVALVVVVGLAAAALFRRRSHDDVHSVEHYHKQLHTLQEMREHPSSDAGSNGNEVAAAYPASAFRVSGSSTVRLTEPDRPLVPPIPPPPVPHAAEPVQFEDQTSESADTQPTTNFMRGDDRALHSIDHRPRKLGAPLAAIGVVVVLIVVLIVTGVHTTTPPHHPKVAGASTTHVSQPSTRPAHAHHPKTSTATTTSTTSPTVSTPKATSVHSATYQVASGTFSLVLSATNGECWVDATTSTGTTLFTGTLLSGQSHTLSATGPVSVIAGAPAAFAATVNGVAVSLPFGFQAPFTLVFQTPGAAAGTTGTAGPSGSGPTG